MGITSRKKQQIQEPSSPPLPTAAPRRRGAAVPSAAGAAVLFLLYLTWRNFDQGAPPQPAWFYTFDLVNQFPHDPNAYTQGLAYGGNDTLFESTGLYQRSSVRHVHLQTGKVLIHHQLDESLFAEGLTLLGERLFQVNWLKKSGFVYDRFNFSKREEFTHQMTDGWGLANDGKVIFGSDGSSTLYHLDPITGKVVRRAIVRYGDREVPFMNEIEYVNGEVWANIWPTDCIARISPYDGNVVGWIRLHELRQFLLGSGHTGINALNGIAWDEENNRLFVTGKLWPKLYEIKLRPLRGPIVWGLDEFCPKGFIEICLFMFVQIQVLCCFLVVHTKAV